MGSAPPSLVNCVERALEELEAEELTLVPVASWPGLHYAEACGHVLEVSVTDDGRTAAVVGISFDSDSSLP